MTVATAKPHLRHIDCLRGYAVLMVLTCHLSYALPQLPYPVARFASMGWYGVQLFFLMSAFTLLNSRTAEIARYGSASTKNFFLRRFLRIAPAYYAAAILYALVRPNFTFDAGQLATALTFSNSWHPATMPTIANKWMVVPGGWSIGVEFSFYALFPLLAAAITSLRRAVIGVALSITVGLMANLLAAHYLAQTTPAVALENFLYFWLPNQMCVFALGMLLFYAMGDGSAFAIRLLNKVRPIRYQFIAASIALFLSTSFVPLAHYSGQASRVPSTIWVSVSLMAFAAAVASGPTIFVNRAAQEIGKVSFSAYLVHFAVIDLMAQFPAVTHFHSTGVSAIGHFTFDWVLLVAITFACSYVLYQAVELPGMLFAKALTKRTATRRHATQPSDCPA